MTALIWTMSPPIPAAKSVIVDAVIVP